MANKSYTKRIKVTRKGKLLARTPGGNHFNAKESRQKQLSRKRNQSVALKNKSRGRFLPNSK
jgi:ribosomal protein L35